MQTRGLIRKSLPLAAATGKWLRAGTGACIGLALARSIVARDWTDILLALAITFAALASVVMHFEPSSDDL